MYRLSGCRKMLQEKKKGIRCVTANVMNRKKDFPRAICSREILLNFTDGYGFPSVLQFLLWLFQEG